MFTHIVPPPPVGGLTERNLRERVTAFMSDYPDVYALAQRAASKIILQHTGTSVDPSMVYWHRFRTASSSAQTFTGWKHNGQPSETLNFIELVMHRFSAADQDASDDLNVYGGFYTAGPDAQTYDERNQVPMLPSDVLRDFWALDFASECKRKVEAFWRHHADDFCAFAKARLLAAAGLELRRKQLTPQDFQAVLKAVTGGTATHVTWSMLKSATPLNPDVSVHTFELAGHASRNMLLIGGVEGRQILYRPDVQPAFLCFDDVPTLARWVKARLNDPSARSTLFSSFARGSQRQMELAEKIIRSSTPLITIHLQRGGTSTRAFEHLRDIARQEMHEDMHEQLVTSAELRKQMWLGYLGAFIQVAGAFAPIGWPVALTLIGAGIASVGLNIDQALHGSTARLKRAGVIGAIINSIYLLFNLPLLADLRRPVPSLVTPEVDVITPAGQLEALEGNVALPDAAPTQSMSHYQGVHVLENGESWISLDDRPFRVQYVQDLKLWFIVNPENPFSFSGAKLVRFNEANEWELVGSPGLRGGAPLEAVSSAALPFETVSSEFWDIYMQFNLSEERRLSDVGNLRQESLANVYEAEEDDEVFTDSDGDDVVIDSFGEKHRVFKTVDDWFGRSITLYTEDEDAYNVFLRTGERKRRDQLGVITRLVEDLAEVDYNNDVTLYRGGSGNRGTSGQVFRDGKFKVGDVLVNTDVTSFSENPYVCRVFASSQGGASSETYRGDITFDDTSVVFELPAKDYLSATPISPFSASPDEVESVFLPGHYFEIQRIQEVAGAHYRFMHVQLKQIAMEQVAGAVYDLRTGMMFSRQQYAEKLGEGAEVLVETFFPLPTVLPTQNH
ncbi:dermonecrotic toxin domain-containing protein [Pseudomonas sp. NPDC088444]|uniref:dermonecrotic toxin domain-containing protein n=1 Tax=Pseudomonas sp. NPDC088444 TaxID=3364456 RepID=UPI00384A815A